MSESQASVRFQFTLKTVAAFLVVAGMSSFAFREFLIVHDRVIDAFDCGNGSTVVVFARGDLLYCDVRNANGRICGPTKIGRMGPGRREFDVLTDGLLLVLLRREPTVVVCPDFEAGEKWEEHVLSRKFCAAYDLRSGQLFPSYSMVPDEVKQRALSIGGDRLLRSLEDVEAFGPISEDLLDSLSLLPKLRRLGLGEDRVTRETIASVMAIGSLEELNLSYAYVENSAIDELASFKSLKKLVLPDGTVSSGQRRVLQESLPETEIVYHARD